MQDLIDRMLDLLWKSEVDFSEQLAKMAVSSIKPGKPLGPHRVAVQVAPGGTDISKHKAFDYTHHLSPEHRKAGYKLRVYDGLSPTNKHLLNVSLEKDSKQAGFLEGNIADGDFEVNHSCVYTQHRGQGLGKKIYEAAYAHGLHHHGVKTVSGDVHSTAAKGVHDALSREHGFDYEPDSEGFGNGSFNGNYDGKYYGYKYAIKSELAKTDDEDPIDPMLSHNDPRERILALKSKLVTPYHLRQALHDEDPDVRAFAAKHPKLSEPMIHEALQHHDLFTREAALSRPDLTPAHIESVLFDPDLQTQAVRHPRCTPEQRERVGVHVATPKGLAEEMFKSEAIAWLRKNVKSGYNRAYEAQLGMNARFEAYLKAAQFLSHNEPNLLIFREALLHGLDLDEAALRSVELDSNHKNQRALNAALQLQESRKAEKLTLKHTVTALMPDGEEAAKAIERGFKEEKQEELDLGGKHSKGTLMVSDPESQDKFLLKPGSGGQSPAKGAREESANQSRREACFWHAADHLGIGNRVPRADLLLVDGKEVACLHMLPFSWKNLEELKYESPGLPHLALEKYRETGELHKWAVADFIFGNPDRHGQNVMVGPEEDDYRVALIDHGSAFAGASFDPANDKNSFIPYYLRAWKANDWHDLDLEDKLRAMPTCGREADEQLKAWLDGVHAGDLEGLLHRYGIDPAPTIARLARVKLLIGEGSLSQAVNKIWLLT